MAEQKHLMKLAIDFGSTNTVMAWRVYENTGNGMKRSNRLNAVNNAMSIPTIMIFKEENRDNEAVKRDLFGKDAENVINGSNTSPLVCNNFKQSLYTASLGSEEYKRGIALTTKFFEYLLDLYRHEIYNRLPDEDARNMRVVLLLSTPVRANTAHRELMKSIAEAGGIYSGKRHR